MANSLKQQYVNDEVKEYQTERAGELSSFLYALKNGGDVSMGADCTGTDRASYGDDQDERVPLGGEETPLDLRVGAIRETGRLDATAPGSTRPADSIPATETRPSESAN